jgi:hypothetical protein
MIRTYHKTVKQDSNHSCDNGYILSLHLNVSAYNFEFDGVYS